MSLSISLFGWICLSFTLHRSVRVYGEYCVSSQLDVLLHDDVRVSECGTRGSGGSTGLQLQALHRESAQRSEATVLLHTNV
ncbi:hypothetical protein BC834DRAFT_888586, partial [Gloeopeniophorella convolvens]